jgi:hypothetical protein
MKNLHWPILKYEYQHILSECYCKDAVSGSGNQSECIANCFGDSNQKCGSSNKIRVVELTCNWLFDK